MAVAGAAVGIGSGIAKAIKGAKARKEAEAEQAKAKAELESQKAAYAALDTSNPFANMENKMEDLTVNQQEAEFMKQQQQQNQANILEGMKGAAGGSGIAALAQQMATQGSLAAQKAAVSIGQQETANQRLKAQEASRLQQMEATGEQAKQQAERDRQATLMGLAAADVEAASGAKAAADTQMMEGIGGIGSAAGGLEASVPGMKEAGAWGAEAYQQ